MKNWDSKLFLNGITWFRSHGLRTKDQLVWPWPYLMGPQGYRCRTKAGTILVDFGPRSVRPCSCSQLLHKVVILPHVFRHGISEFLFLPFPNSPPASFLANRPGWEQLISIKVEKKVENESKYNAFQVLFGLLSEFTMLFKLNLITILAKHE